MPCDDTNLISEIESEFAQTKLNNLAPYMGSTWENFDKCSFYIQHNL